MEENKMTKEQQKKLMQEFLKKQQKEVKLTKDNFNVIVSGDGSLQGYKQIRVILKDLQKHRFKLERGDYIAICNIKKIGEKIYLETDVGNILQPLAPVYKHSSMHFQFSDFQKIWNNSVEM